MWRVWALILFLLAGCASTTYRPPTVQEDADVEIALLREAYRTTMARRARVYDLAWPVLTANTDLCPNTVPSIGIVLGDRETAGAMAGGLRAEDVAALGVADAVQIIHAHRGGPAAMAGVRAGDIVVAINGEAIGTPQEASTRIKAATEAAGEVTLRLSDGDAQEREITPRSVHRCDIAVKIASVDALNASASTGDIVIYQGLIRSLDDGALQFVIAHEAAHLALRHPRKYVRNLTVTGAAFVGPVLYSAAWTGDRVSRVLGHRPDVSLRQRAVRRLAPWAAAFELEADYLGLYMLARAGGDLAGAQQAFETFGREVPASIYTRASHPTVPQRLDVMRATMAEITDKQRQGQPLMPTPAER